MDFGSSLKLRTSRTVSRAVSACSSLSFERLSSLLELYALFFRAGVRLATAPRFVVFCLPLVGNQDKASRQCDLRPLVIGDEIEGGEKSRLYHLTMRPRLCIRWSTTLLIFLDGFGKVVRDIGLIPFISPFGSWPGQRY